MKERTGSYLRVIALFAVALLAIAASGTPAGAAGPDYKFTSSGDSGWVSWSSANGDHGYVNAMRSDNRYGTYAHVSYFVQRGSSVEAGYGQIPASALSGSPATGMSLDIDTSTLGPYFYRTAGSGGVISVTWTRTNMSRSSWSGRQEYIFDTPWGETLTFRLIGSSQYFSAAATGTVFGSAPTGDWKYAEVGQNHQVQFTYVQQ